MKFHNITKDDMLNGEGLRVVLWVSGCPHQCLGCHNPITWNENDGLDFDEASQLEIFNELEKDYISGLTISGGDPLFAPNQEAVYSLLKNVKAKYPQKTVWVYTGYSWDDIKALPLLKYIDVLVDGKFILSLKDTALHWKGSSNQNVIDVQKTLQNGKIILFKEI